MKLTFLFYVCIGIVVFTLMGCSENRPLDMILDEATRPTNEIVSQTAACFKALDVNEAAQEYNIALDKPCIDAVFMTGASPELPASATPADFQTVVASVVSGSDMYRFKAIGVSARVLSKTEQVLSLVTGDPQVNFIVSAMVKDKHLDHFVIGNTYKLPLIITSTKKENGLTKIFAWTDTPTNIDHGTSAFTPASQAVTPVTIAAMLESFRRGESYYIGKRVSFTARVIERAPNGRIEVYRGQSPVWSLEEDYFSIYADNDLTATPNKYAEGSVHAFVVTIHFVSGEGYFDDTKVKIIGTLKDEGFLARP